MVPDRFLAILGRAAEHSGQKTRALRGPVYWESIPGVELVEMYRIKEYAWCCGAGGGVIDAYPEFNAFTAAERVKEARETGAEAIVTACPWCERSLTDAISITGDKMRVLDVVELARQAI